MNLDEDGSFHVHMEDDPYCISYSYFRKEEKEKRELIAKESAREFGGVVVGPFEFDYAHCIYRAMKRASAETDMQERLDRVANDENIPENERTLAEDYAHIYKKNTYVGWHVHTDGQGSGWCRSFSSRDRAYRWIQEAKGDDPPPRNPRIVGPLRHPAVACQYFHDNDPAYREARNS